MYTVSRLFVAIVFQTIVALGLGANDIQPANSSKAITQEPIVMEHAAPMKHSAGTTLSFAQLRATVAKLTRARRATAKYRDVRKAEADGYRSIGPYVPGMGIHYVRSDLGERSVDLEHPPILLYGKDPKGSGGHCLVGVSYLLNAPAGPDGQPVNSPFPKALAHWHKHRQVCVLPNSDATVELTEEQCKARKGEFIPETPWMVHAWIWQDSPAGVFSFTNPTVK